MIATGGGAFRLFPGELSWKGHYLQSLLWRKSGLPKTIYIYPFHGRCNLTFLSKHKGNFHWNSRFGCHLYGLSCSMAEKKDSKESKKAAQACGGWSEEKVPAFFIPLMEEIMQHVG